MIPENVAATQGPCSIALLARIPGNATASAARGASQPRATGVIQWPVKAKRLSIQDWIPQIQEACRNRAHKLLELAGLMSRVRTSLAHGDWGQLWDAQAPPLAKLPLCRRTANMLVTIGLNLSELANGHNHAHLPAALNTLYFLAQLGRQLVEQLIREGRIHPRLTLAEAKALLAQFKPHSDPKSARSAIRQRAARFERFLREGLAAWTPGEREFLRHKFNGWIELVAFKNLRPQFDTSPKTPPQHHSNKNGTLL